MVVCVALFFTYLVAGIVSKKRGNADLSGLALLPNSDFWRQTFTDIIIGFKFAFRLGKARGKLSAVEYSDYNRL